MSNPENEPKMEKFNINIPLDKIEDLKNRINNTRWIRETSGTGWGDPSLDTKTIKELCHYWQEGFDWKKQEAYINGFPHYKALVKDINLHFVHQKGTASKHIPILFLHGWASNFTEFLQTAELIKSENAAYDIIIPSLPGFAFSDEPGNMASESAAEYVHHLMTELLGYQDYYVHGSDYGAFIGEKLALKFPEAVKGLYLSDIPFYHLYEPHENLSEAEDRYIQKINDWFMTDGAYGMIQGTKPKALSTGLNDSPTALAAWLLQLYFDFGDKALPIFERYSKDDLLVNISLYWHTATIYSCMRLYSEDMSGFDGRSVEKVSVPVGFNFHKYDISGDVPREFAERLFSNIISWTVVDEGGHFSGLSHPHLLKNDLLDFIEQIE